MIVHVYHAEIEILSVVDKLQKAMAVHCSWCWLVVIVVLTTYMYAVPWHVRHVHCKQKFKTS